MNKLENKIGVIEGLLFVMGDEGITLEELSSIIECNLDECKALLLELKKNYEENDRGLRIRYLGNAFKLTTKEEHKPYYQKLMLNPSHQELSEQALEVLAIVAYKGPVTRVEVDELRGLSSAFTIRKLVARGFIKECGKSEMPGRPNLYKITNECLDYFGLSNVNDLPKLPEIIEETKEEQNLFTSIYKEEHKEPVEA